MGGRGLALIGAILFAALAITAVLLDQTRQDSAGIEPSVATPLVSVPDPLAGELQRCQLLGEAGARDAACLAVWAENRRRFLNPGDAAPVSTSAMSKTSGTASEGTHQK